MMRNGILLAALFLLLAAAGCQSDGAAFVRASDEGYAATPDAVAPGLFELENKIVAGEARYAALAADRNAIATDESGSLGKAEQAQPGKRLVIYNADLQVRVANLESAKRRFLELAEAAGGYLQQQRDHTLTVRVPATRFDEIVRTVKEFGSVIKENITAKDITREFLDIEIRLDNAIKARDRLATLLDRADKVADLLEIEREMKRLTEEIERLKGQIRYFKDQVAFSTVTVAFNAPSAGVRPVRQRSRFEWVNKIGVDHVLSYF